MPYPKLVRDRIPAIIAESGRQCHTTVLTKPAFQAALLDKLVEEAQEAQVAPAEELLAELADVLEVFETLLVTHHFTMDQVRQFQLQKRMDRGGFSSQLQIDWVEEA
jgi:predicted house-cleaning noncanonical NTP pyrophosphatase (MazG superfamily)